MLTLRQISMHSTKKLIISSNLRQIARSTEKKVHSQPNTSPTIGPTNTNNRQTTSHTTQTLSVHTVNAPVTGPTIVLRNKRTNGSHHQAMTPAGCSKAADIQDIILPINHMHNVITIAITDQTIIHNVQTTPNPHLRVINVVYVVTTPTNAQVPNKDPHTEPPIVQCWLAAKHPAMKLTPRSHTRLTNLHKHLQQCSKLRVVPPPSILHIQR